MKHKLFLFIECLISMSQSPIRLFCNCCSLDRTWFPTVHVSDAWSPGGSKGRLDKLKRWSLVEGLQVILRVFLKGVWGWRSLPQPTPPETWTKLFCYSTYSNDDMLLPTSESKGVNWLDWMKPTKLLAQIKLPCAIWLPKTFAIVTKSGLTYTLT